MKGKIFLIFLSLLFLSSCQSFKDNSENYLIDIHSSTKELTVFGENVISTPLYERDMAISPQGDEIMYTLGDYKQNKRALVALKKQNGAWNRPEILNISGKYKDIEPFFSYTGNRLYFASNRPIYNDNTRKDYNIWISDRIDGIWSEPVPLDSIINTRGDEFFPSLSKKGNLFFTATREDGIGKEDIYVSEFKGGKFTLPKPLSSEINSPLYEFNAFISPNEKYLIFSSFGRDDGFGGGDLYISVKDTAGNWKMARNLGENINSDKLDFCPFVDWESKNFYFTSERVAENNNRLETVNELKQITNGIENGFGNIYRIRFEELKLVEE